MAEKDVISGQEKDTILEGHDADGILEFDNDMPMWWLVGFIITVVFSFGYLVQYHMSDGPSSAKEYEQEVAAFNKSKDPNAGQQEIVLNPLTDTASLDAGRLIFEGASNTCYTCHRNDLGGIVGPNLTDEFWIHGGDLRAIMKSIKSGYPDKGMQPYGTNARLSERQVLQVASYVLSKQGSKPENPKPIDPARELKFVPEPAADVAVTQAPPVAANQKANIKNQKAKVESGNLPKK